MKPTRITDFNEIALEAFLKKYDLRRYGLNTDDAKNMVNDLLEMAADTGNAAAVNRTIDQFSRKIA